MIQKSNAEQEIRYLISQWRRHESRRDVCDDKLHCSDFIDWLRENSPGHLDFRSTMPGEDCIESWFDQELKQAWRN